MKLCKYPEVVTFLGMMFLLGNMWGFVKSYLFVLLKNELQAPTYLLGKTTIINACDNLLWITVSQKILLCIFRLNCHCGMRNLHPDPVLGRQNCRQSWARQCHRGVFPSVLYPIYRILLP